MTRFFLILFFFSFVHAGYTQFSIGFNIGYQQSLQRFDDYRLDRQWRDSNFGSSGSVAFFDESTTGITTSATIAWEATKHLSLFTELNLISYKLPESKRTANSTHVGVGMKINFLSHDKTVVPFIQGVFMFYNTIEMKQESASMDVLRFIQTQPRFTRTVKPSFGVGGDAGVEIKVTQAINIVTSLGLRLTEGTVKEESEKLLEGLTWSSTNPDGVLQPPFFTAEMWHVHARIGAKYYISKRKKKRDF